MSKPVRGAAPKYGKLIVEAIKANLGYYVDQIIDLFDRSREQDDHEVMKWFAKEIPGKRSWELYVDREPYIVTNVKGQGFPDYDAVVELAAREGKVDEARIRNHVTPAFFDDYFWDQVKDAREAFDTQVSAVGRSGGYWGLPFDSSWVVGGKAKIKQGLNEILRDNTALTEISKKMDGSTSPTEAVENALLSYVEDHWDMFEYLDISKAEVQMFETLGQQIASMIKDFESPERWAGDIVANQWWEEAQVASVISVLDDIAASVDQDLAAEIDAAAFAMTEVSGAKVDLYALEHAINREGFKFNLDPAVTLRTFANDLKRYGLQRAGTELFHSLEPHGLWNKTQEGNFLMMLKKFVGAEVKAAPVPSKGGRKFDAGKPNVLNWMKHEAKNCEDPKTGEVNTTELAENAAHEFDSDEWLDDDTHWVWDLAVKAAEWYQQQAAGGVIAALDEVASVCAAVDPKLEKAVLNFLKTHERQRSNYVNIDEFVSKKDTKRREAVTEILKNHGYAVQPLGFIGKQTASSILSTLDEVAAALETEDPILAYQTDQLSQSLAQDEANAAFQVYNGIPIVLDDSKMEQVGHALLPLLKPYGSAKVRSGIARKGGFTYVDITNEKPGMPLAKVWEIQVSVHAEKSDSQEFTLITTVMSPDATFEKDVVKKLPSSSADVHAVAGAAAEMLKKYLPKLGATVSATEAGSDRLIPYVVKVIKNFGHVGMTPMEFKPKDVGGKTDRHLAKWIEHHNASLEPGGVNQHLGSAAMILEAVLIDQKTGQKIAHYKMANPPMFVAY